MEYTKRDYILSLICENARKNAKLIGIAQYVKIRGNTAIMENSEGSFDISDGVTNADKIDYSTVTMIDCPVPEEGRLAVVCEFLSKFPDGSQMIFVVPFKEDKCSEILSSYGLKVYEYVNLNALAKHVFEESHSDKLYYCLAVKM